MSNTSLVFASLMAAANEALSCVTGRPSACQRANPPSSTAQRSKPTERNIHHKRVAHIGLPVL